MLNTQNPLLNQNQLLNQNSYLQNLLYNTAPQMEIQKVSGEESVYAFPMGPNSSVILLDTTQPLIWVVVTDASSYKTVSPFTITPYIPEKPITTSDLNETLQTLIGRLEKLEERMNSNVQSNNGSTWENKPGDARTQSNAGNGKSISKPNVGASTNGTK